MVMGSAMSKWSKTVTEAAQLAANVTGYNSRTIQKWAQSFFNTDLSSVDIEDLFSSDSSHSSPHKDSK